MRNSHVSGPNGYWHTHFRVFRWRWGLRQRNAGGLPGRSRLYIFHHLVPVNYEWLKRTQLAIGDARMLELAELVADPWHPRQSAAHYANALPATHHNSITVVIQLAYRAFFQFGTECHCNVTRIHQNAAFASARRVLGREQCGP